jgi:hypothetical protein
MVRCTQYSPGKYKLADYRYGREEMLALNNPNTTEPSEELRKLTTIFVEKAQIVVIW